MIGFLQGSILETIDDAIILGVSGVGYQVHIPQREILPPLGENISLFIHTHVREDALMLFGFYTKLEKDLFLQLIKVSGVGAKTALLILSMYQPDQIITMIAQKDTKSLCKVKGIGKKAAEKIMLELSDKIKKLSSNLTISTSVNSFSSPDDELVSALVNLGYKRQNIEQTLANIEFEDGLGFDQKFKRSLQQLSKSS